MPVLTSLLDTTSEAYVGNRKAQLENIAALDEQLDLVVAGGGER
ncbi:MAG: acyl-CoA carboxylase subunit beta, partial [Actinomycetota bacterium]|nr:acyl-CoA carboxylase subunit beta [Actinomycetota bacterium]